MNKKEKVKKERVQSRYCKERSNRERERERERERHREREGQKQSNKKLREKRQSEGKKMYNTCERIEKKQEIVNHYINPYPANVENMVSS